MGGEDDLWHLRGDGVGYVCAGLRVSTKRTCREEGAGEQAPATALLGPGRVCAEATPRLDCLQRIAEHTGMRELAVPSQHRPPPTQ